MDHIETAKAQAEQTDLAHPYFEKRMLNGILHALIAIHEQGTGKTAPVRKPSTKETSK